MCALVPAQSVLAFSDLPFGCAVLYTDIYLFVCTLHHDMSACLPDHVCRLARLLFILEHYKLLCILLCANILCSSIVVCTWAVVLVSYSTLVLQASMRHPAWKTSAGE